MKAEHNYELCPYFMAPKSKDHVSQSRIVGTYPAVMLFQSKILSFLFQLCMTFTTRILYPLSHVRNLSIFGPGQENSIMLFVFDNNLGLEGKLKGIRAEETNG